MRPAPLALAALVVGCAGSETGNGFAEVDLELRAFNDAVELFATDKDGVELTIDAATLAVTRIDFMLPPKERCSERLDVSPPDVAYTVACRDDRRLGVTGPWRVDLVSGAFEPSVAGLTLPTGDYERVEVEVAPGLDGVTLAVSGTVPVDGEDLPYALVLAFRETARFTGMQSFDVDSAAGIALLLDVRGWFDEVSLARCIADGHVPIVDGVARVDEATGPCGNVESRVRKAVREAGKIKKGPPPKP